MATYKVARAFSGVNIRSGRPLNLLSYRDLRILHQVKINYLKKQIQNIRTDISAKENVNIQNKKWINEKRELVKFLLFFSNSQ